MSWQQYLKHYVLGLAGSCWNAGVSALYATFGQSVGAGIMKDVPAPSLHEIGAIFVGAAAIEALLYFKTNPVPVLKAATSP